MNFVLQSLKTFPVSVGNITLYLSVCQVTETSTLKESGTASGGNVLSGYWPKGIRITLKGKLPPSVPTDQIIYALSQAILTEQALSFTAIRFETAMLCSYTVTDQQETPEITLVYYSSQKPVMILQESEVSA